MLAHHYSEAVAPGIAELAWRDREEEREQLSAAALRWLRRAAELALARFDLDDALAQLYRAAELAPGDARVWHAIGRVNALKFDGEAMWPAMEKAIELTERTEVLAELYAELSFESTMRGGMWKRPLDHGLVESWLARALELADAGGAAHAKALVAKSMWEDDAEAAEQAVPLAERLDDPVLLSYAYWARSGAAFVALDFHEADRWAQRRFELLDRLTDPDKIAHIHFYGATAALAAGRPDEAETLVRKHDIVASRLSPHHEVHALGVLLFVEEALGHWDEVRRLQHRVERAVADNQGTPCVLNPRTLFSCAVACGELGLDAEAQRLEEAAVEQGFQDGGMGFWLDPPPAHLALLRGDLERVDALLESSGATWHLSLDGSLYALATKLDALIALGRTQRGRGSRDLPSSAGDVSRAVRATHARSRAQRPHLDRTGDRALRGHGARLARGEDTRARAGVGQAWHYRGAPGRTVYRSSHGPVYAVSSPAVRDTDRRPRRDPPTHLGPTFSALSKELLALSRGHAATLRIRANAVEENQWSSNTQSGSQGWGHPAASIRASSWQRSSLPSQRSSLLPASLSGIRGRRPSVPASS